jgi:SAM-dependent methyltransferase
MRDAAPFILDRIYSKLRKLISYPIYKRYLSKITSSHPLHGIPTRLTADVSADPTEFFDHYDAFAHWATKRIFAKGRRLKTLDVGSIKMMNGILSNMHDVTALVLADCSDSLSQVNYVKHDVAEQLPFQANSFDVFTSMVSLPIVGLARYGDKLDADCLMRFVVELGRVMRPDGELLISMCLGKNVLNFNNGWFFDMPTIERIFDGWTVLDRLVDLKSSPYGANVSTSQRFTTDTSVENIRFGDYRVVFLHLRRQT